MTSENLSLKYRAGGHRSAVSLPPLAPIILDDESLSFISDHPAITDKSETSTVVVLIITMRMLILRNYILSDFANPRSLVPQNGSNWKAKRSLCHDLIPTRPKGLPADPTERLVPLVWCW